jgi:hypothetical protein
LHAQQGLVCSSTAKPLCIHCQQFRLPMTISLLQLISGDAGGEIRVWNISEASLVPILVLSTPGSVTAALVTHVAQAKIVRRYSRQVVAGTNHGDVFVWDVDMGNLSEPWEPHNAVVLQVGMLSLSNTAVTQLQDIPGGMCPCLNLRFHDSASFGRTSF